MERMSAAMKGNPAKASLRAALGVCVLALVSVTAYSQDALLPNLEGEITFESAEPPAFEPRELDPSYTEALSVAQRRKAENEEALRRLNDAMIVSTERQAELAQSVAALDTDREALVDQLIGTARSIQNLEDALTDTEQKLLNLVDEEKRIQLSLVERRAILAEVLAALQRMGQNPPPAIVVNASDALQSVRSAILLGSVLPELKSEAEALNKDLKALSDVKLAVQVEQKELIDQERQLSEEQLRLDLLIKENQKLRVTSDEKRLQEREKVRALARDATNLRDLVSRITSEISSVTQEVTSAEAAARREADARRAAHEAQQQRDVAVLSGLRPEVSNEGDDTVSSPNRETAAQEGGPIGATRTSLPQRVVDYSDILKDNEALNASVTFAKMKGLLRFPARGTELTTFGGSDGLGGISKGITIATRPKTPVTAPSPGRVVFAGPFPGYERLLIIDVGDGYHIVLAGMGKINVNIGDYVKAGQPVALMGGKRLARLAGLPVDIVSVLDNDFSSSQTQPVLYVEFRKNSKSINSSPWWANL